MKKQTRLSKAALSTMLDEARGEVNALESQLVQERENVTEAHQSAVEYRDRYIKELTAKGIYERLFRELLDDVIAHADANRDL